MTKTQIIEHLKAKKDEFRRKGGCHTKDFIKRVENIKTNKNIQTFNNSDEVFKELAI